MYVLGVLCVYSFVFHIRLCLQLCVPYPIVFTAMFTVILAMFKPCLSHVYDTSPFFCWRSLCENESGFRCLGGVYKGAVAGKMVFTGLLAKFN
jgi:hypothetical protein